MFLPRTDLAFEANERFIQSKAPEGKIDGIETEQEDFDNLWINRIKILNNTGSEALGRPIGNYITINVPDIRYDNSALEEACNKISEEIKKLIDFKITAKHL